MELFLCDLDALLHGILDLAREIGTSRTGRNKRLSRDKFRKTGIGGAEEILALDDLALALLASLDGDSTRDGDATDGRDTFLKGDALINREDSWDREDVKYLSDVFSKSTTSVTSLSPCVP